MKSDSVADLPMLTPVKRESISKDVSTKTFIKQRLEPGADAHQLDVQFGREVGKRAASVIAEAAKTVLGRLNQHNNRAALATAHLDFDAEENNIRDLQSQLSMELLQSESDVSYSHSKYADARDYFEAFKQRRKLARPAKSKPNQLNELSTLAILIIFESVFNAIFLAFADPQGPVWGMFSAFLISFLNVLFFFLIGFYFCKRISSIFWVNRILGVLVLGLSLVSLGAFHYLITRYRSVMEKVGSEIENGGEFLTTAQVFQRTLNEILANPISMGDVNALLLFVIGIVFGAYALFKGYRFGDEYPGFTNAQSEFEKHREKFMGQQNLALTRSQDIREEMVQHIDNFIRAAENGRQIATNYRSVSTELLMSFRTFHKSVEVASQEAVTDYANAVPDDQAYDAKSRITNEVSDYLTEPVELQATVDAVSATAIKGSEDADLAREKARALRTEVIAEIDSQIETYRSKYSHE